MLLLINICRDREVDDKEHGSRDHENGKIKPSLILIHWTVYCLLSSFYLHFFQLNP